MLIPQYKISIFIQILHTLRYYETLFFAASFHWLNHLRGNSATTRGILAEVLIDGGVFLLYLGPIQTDTTPPPWREAGEALKDRGFLRLVDFVKAWTSLWGWRGTARPSAIFWILPPFNISLFQSVEVSGVYA